MFVCGYGWFGYVVGLLLFGLGCDYGLFICMVFVSVVLCIDFWVLVWCFGGLAGLTLVLLVVECFGLIWFDLNVFGVALFVVF